MKPCQIMKLLFNTLTILFLTFGLAACGGSSGGKSSSNSGSKDPGADNSAALTGFAQKGPLQAGGTVTLEPLNSDGTSIGQALTATLNELGGYSLKLDKITWQGPTLITARSPYFNENKEIYENSVMGNGLQVIADLPAESKVNINLFTHLVAARTRHLMEHESLLFSSARTQARDELVSLLNSGTGAWPIPISSEINPLRLNLLDREKVQFTNYLSAEQDSVSLLLFSSALLTVLDNPDWNSTPSGFGGGSSSDGLDKATGDFSDDGLINGEGKDLIDKMKTAADKAGEKISKVTKNLKTKFNKLELFPEAPNIDSQDAADALKDVLTDRHLQPDAGTGRTLDDYIRTHVSNGNVRVSVGLDADGRLVPNEDWYAANDEYCKARARHAAQAVETLVFKMYRTTEVLPDGTTRDQYYVFAQILNSKTSRIQAQQEGDISAMYQAGFEVPEGATPHKDTLAIGMERALEGLTYAKTNVSAEPRAPASSPCGDIRLVHVSGSEVGEDVTFMTGFDGVDTPGLTYGYQFGDGTGEDPAPRTTSHIYAEEGTYKVEVYVRGAGEDASGTQSVNVEIKKADYTFQFDSTFVYNFTEPQSGTSITGNARYKTEVRLTRDSEGVYRGNAPMPAIEVPNVTLPTGNQPVPKTKLSMQVRAIIPDGTSHDDPEVWFCYDKGPLYAGSGSSPWDMGGLWQAAFLSLHINTLGQNNAPADANCATQSDKYFIDDWDAGTGDTIGERSWVRATPNQGLQDQEKTYISLLKKD